MNIIDSNRLKRALINRIAKAEGKFAIVIGYKVKPQEETGNETPYGIYVHEIGAFHAPPTKSRFLADPFRRVIKEVPSIVQREMVSKRRSFSDALLTVGKKIKKESEVEVPVDTGALKASAFVAKELVNG